MFSQKLYDKYLEKITAANVLVGLIDGKPQVLICRGVSDDGTSFVARTPRVNSKEYKMHVVSLGRNMQFGSEAEYLLNGEKIVSISLYPEIMHAIDAKADENITPVQIKAVQKYILAHKSMFYPEENAMEC